MTPDDCKLIMREFDRLNLEIPEGLNLLTNKGLISDHVVLLGDVAHEDGRRCVAALMRMKSKDE